MGDDEELTDEERQHKQLRLVGYGIAVSGVVTLLVSTASTRPHGILVFGLGALAVATLVFERTQGAAVGLSLGFLTGSFGVWMWPHLGGESYTVLAAMLFVVGLVNAATTPYFRALGERLADR